tara:strand:- start:89 stop:715 length:627 start_codon:yes stop_codon:yes gene_type:complete
MGIRNDNIELGYQSLFIPATSFSGIGLITGSQGSEQIVAAGANNKPLDAAGSTGLVGVQFANNGDRVQTLAALPTYIDTNSDIYVRCFWFSTANSGSFQPVVTYKQIGNFDAVPAETDSKTALNIAIPSDSCNTSSQFYATSAGTISAGSLEDADGQFDALLLQVQAADFSGAADFSFLGLELWFMPKLTPGAQKSKVALPAKVVVAE